MRAWHGWRKLGGGLLLGLAVCGGTARAATFYVDVDAGKDSNAGAEPVSGNGAASNVVSGNQMIAFGDSITCGYWAAGPNGTGTPPYAIAGSYCYQDRGWYSDTRLCHSSGSSM